MDSNFNEIYFISKCKKKHLDKIIEKLNLDIDDSDEKIRLTMQNCQMDKLVRKKIIRFLKQKYKSSNFTIDNETSTMSTTTTIDGQESETQITPNPSAPPLTTTIEIVESNPIVQVDSPPLSPLAITDPQPDNSYRPNRNGRSCIKRQRFYQGKHQYRCKYCNRPFRSNRKRLDHYQSKHQHLI